MERRDLNVKDGESLRYYLIFSSEVSAHFYVNPRSHLYVHYPRAQKELLKEAFLTEKM